MTARCVSCGRFKVDACTRCEEKLYNVLDSIVGVAMVATLIRDAQAREVIEAFGKAMHDALWSVPHDR